MIVRQPAGMLVACALVMLLLGGCGSDDTAAPSSTPGVTVRDESTRIEGTGSTFESGTSLPKGWPAEIDLPAGAVITTATRREQPERCELTVTSTIPGAHVPAVEQHFTNILQDWKRTASSDTGAGDTRIVNRTYERADDVLQVTVSLQTGRTMIVSVVTRPC